MKTEWMKNDNRAIALLRISSHRQKDNSSHDTQESDVSTYCFENELNLIETFKMIESAKDSDHRKKYHEALAFARKRGIKHVLFYMFDRETRNLTDNEANEKAVKAGELIIHYVRERKVIHQGSSDSEFLMRDFQAVSNKQFIRNLSAKVQDAMRKKAESGWFPSNHVPLGYMHQKVKNESGKEQRRGTIIVKDININNVKLVVSEFSLRAKGYSLEQIRQKNIELDLVSNIKSYCVGSIDRRLKNKFYRGYFDWHGVEYKGSHDLIIDKDILDKIDIIIGLKTRVTKRQQSGIFGGGWLKCADKSCGCNIVYDPKNKTLSTGETKTYHFYHCSNGRRVHLNLKGMNVTEENLWEQLGHAVDDISITEERATLVADALNKTHEQALRAIKGEMSGYRAGLDRIQERRNKLIDLMMDGVIEQSEFKSQSLRLDNENKVFLQQLESAQIAISGAYMKTAKDILELATRAKSLWIRRSPQERKQFLDLILSNQVLDGASVRYELKKPFVVLAKIGSKDGWRTAIELFRTAVIEMAA